MESFFVIIMAVTSITGLTFIIERGLALRWNKVIPRSLENAVEACRTPGDLPMLRRVCEQNPSAFSRLLQTAEQHLDLPREDNESAVQSRARTEIVKLERGLIVLEIVVGIAPLLGLVGTIQGMIVLFGSLGQSGLNDNAVLARGISLILGFTMTGLLIAIPSLIAWSYYSKKVENMAIEMESLVTEFFRRQYRASAKK